MKLVESTEDNVISLHIELNTGERIKYPGISRTRVNIVMMTFLFLILLIWIIRNDGIPGATDREAFALAVLLPLALFLILTFYNFWILGNTESNKLCLIQIKTDDKTLRLNDTTSDWEKIQSIVTSPKKIGVLQGNENLEDIKEFSQLQTIYYDIMLSRINPEEYQTLVNEISQRVSELIEVPIVKFNQE